jgi:2-polyprenyl-3-methyl-5-hydroxy-6-metoxy-1,4-benzoquinol methylase
MIKAKEPLLEPFLRKMRIGKVLDEIKKIQNCVLLDIGCGFNHKFLSCVEPYITQGLGIDFKVQEKSSDTISTIKMRLDERLHCDSCTFDAVTMLAVLEHIEKPQQIVSEVYRVLKPGGKFILTVPGKRAKPVLEFLALRIGVISRKEIEDHKKYYDLEELHQLFAEVGGFELIQHKHFQFGMNNFCVVQKKTKIRKIFNVG